MLSIFSTTEEYTRTQLKETERWMKRVPAIRSSLANKEKAYQAKINKPGYLEERMYYKSPSDIELDVRVGGSSHRSPTETTIEICYSEGDKIELLKADFATLEMALYDAIVKAAETAGENSVAKVRKALGSYFWRGVKDTEVDISINTFRKYKKRALQNATRSLEILRESGNLIIEEYDGWPPA